MPSLPPPNTMISSRMTAARCPCLDRGVTPATEGTLLHRGSSAESAVIFSSPVQEAAAAAALYRCAPFKEEGAGPGGAGPIREEQNQAR